MTRLDFRWFDNRSFEFEIVPPDVGVADFVLSLGVPLLDIVLPAADFTFGVFELL